MSCSLAFKSGEQVVSRPTHFGEINPDCPASSSDFPSLVESEKSTETSNDTLRLLNQTLRPVRNIALPCACERDAIDYES